MKERRLVKRIIGSIVLLAGCAGDPSLDVSSEVEGAAPAAQALTEVIPEAQWRPAPACGEALAAHGAVLRVEGEPGLRAWVAPDRRVLCVDSARRFRFELEERGAEPSPRALSHRASSYGRTNLRGGEPNPQPMTRAGEPNPQPMTWAGEPNPQPMTRKGEPNPQPMTWEGEPNPQPMVQVGDPRP